MSCTNPLLAFRKSDGSLEFLNRDRWSIYEAERYYGKENVFFIPCGKCSACRLAKRKEYAVRCAMEAKEYGDNCCFITLTYDEYHNKGYLLKRDFQYFLKKLRNKGYKFRYFGCGEYGSINNRPHYHIILFGYRPKDLKVIGESETKQKLFTSEEISTLWNKGLVSVQNFEPGVASYVAGYVNKKIDDKGGFLLMSKKPGLGFNYLMKNKDKLLEDDCIHDDFGSLKKVIAPRYFSQLCDRFGIDRTYSSEKRLEVMSEAIAGEMLLFGKDRESLMKQKAVIFENRERRLKRTL